MRRIGLAFALLAAIPAISIPLLACIAVISAPAALIAGIAAISMPVHNDPDRRATTVADATPVILEHQHDVVHRWSARH